MPRRPQSLTLVAKPESLGRVTQFVRKGAQQANLPESRMGELDLLIEEVFMNISRHSYPQGASGIVTVTCFIPAPGELAIEVGDQGIEFNPLTTSPPDLTLDLARRPIGGLGVFLLKSFANSLSYRREEGWNRLTFGISSNR